MIVSDPPVKARLKSVWSGPWPYAPEEGVGLRLEGVPTDRAAFVLGMMANGCHPKAARRILDRMEGNGFALTTVAANLYFDDIIYTLEDLGVKASITAPLPGWKPRFDDGPFPSNFDVHAFLAEHHSRPAVPKLTAALQEHVHSAITDARVDELERLRHLIDPSAIFMIHGRPIQMLEVALQHAWGLGDEKSEKEADEMDVTAVWLIERALELGDDGILTRPIYAGASPIERAQAVLCPKTVLLLMEHGQTPGKEVRSIFSPAPWVAARERRLHEVCEVKRRELRARQALAEMERLAGPSPRIPDSGRDEVRARRALAAVMSAARSTRSHSSPQP